MNPRMLQIINELAPQQAVKPADLARRVGLSTRSVRGYVARINERCAGTCRIESDRLAGYSLVIEDEAAYQRLNARLPACKEGLSLASAQRIDRLFDDLLNRTEWITIESLSNMLYVSRVTISEDLKVVECRAARFGLTLERKPYRGIRLVGPEFKRRLCIAARTLEHMRAGDEPTAQSVNEIDLAYISEAVDEATQREGVHINFVSYQNLIVHIAIMLERVRGGCYVPMETEQFDRIQKTEHYSCAQRIVQTISTRYDMDIPREEIAYTAIHLAGKQSVLLDGDDEDAELSISSDVWEIVSRIIKRIWDAYRFDFSSDIELRMNLARHIVPLAVRMHYALPLSNPLLSGIKDRFPLAYSMALDASIELEQAFEANLSDDETGYIALAFALALERLQSGLVDKKRILIVCASGAGTARLLEHRFQEFFGPSLESIATCDAHAVRDVDFSKIDYVFTTVPLKEQLSVPICHVGYFLDDEDIEHVRRALASRNAAGVTGYFARDLFLPHLACTSKDEVISVMCAHISRVRNIPDDFEELVRQREEAAQTAFGNRVALPHPYRAVTNETLVCVGILEEPIEWNEREVQAVFLVSVSKDGGAELQGFYRSLTQLLVSHDRIDELIEHRSFGTLLEAGITYHV